MNGKGIEPPEEIMEIWAWRVRELSEVNVQI
jgi:hypothetical protein